MTDGIAADLGERITSGAIAVSKMNGSSVWVKVRRDRPFAESPLLL